MEEKVIGVEIVMELRVKVLVGYLYRRVSGSVRI